MKRSHLVLGVTLAVQVALILLLRSPFSASSGRQQPTLLLPSLQSLEATRLQLEGAGDAQVTLVRDGEAWNLEQLDGFPADAKKVEELLHNLKGLQVRRPVVSSARYHAQFKVQDETHEGRVRVWGAAGSEPAADLIIGSSPDYRTLNVRRAGADPVYEVRGLAAYDLRADAEAWIKKQLVAAEEQDVVELTLANAKGSFTLQKKDGAWTVAAPARDQGRALDADRAAALVRAVTSLRLSEGAGRLDAAAQGLLAPAATVSVRWAGDEPGECTIRFGAKPPDKDSLRYVGWTGSDHAGMVWDSSVTRLIDEGLDAVTGA